MKRLPFWILLSLLVTTYGCASTVVPGRLYSLEQPTKATMSFQFTGQRNGVARATLSSGENLNGEFVIWAERTGSIDPEVLEEGGIKKGNDGSPPMEWPVVYGYGSNSEEADPVGSAMLLGSSGTSLEIVLYHAMFETSWVGDGLARDNKGNWYRVMLGDLD